MIEIFNSLINIKPLDASLQLLASNFHCGNSKIDWFLKNPTALDIGFGKTFVWLEDDNKRIIGFYNISTGCINGYDGHYFYKLGGCVHINEFALDETYHGIQIADGSQPNMSDALLSDCIERILFLRKQYVGFSFITLQSTREGYSLYRRHDFEELEGDMDITNIQGEDEDCKPMFLALDIE